MERDCLDALYNHYHVLHPDRDEDRYAVKQAGRALGHLSKREIMEDKRHFTSDVKEQVRH